jgi:hypothetical protein
MEVQVSKWYRRGEYRFIYILNIEDGIADTTTITYYDSSNYSRGYRVWSIKDIQDLFVEMTEEDIELYKPKMLLPIKL